MTLPLAFFPNWLETFARVLPFASIVQVPIDVYLVAHHANNDPNLPGTLEALQPRVAIANNGPWKGTTTTALAQLHAFRGLEDVWQLHRTINDGAVNFPDAFVANLMFNEGDGAAFAIEVETDTRHWEGARMRPGESGQITIPLRSTAAPGVYARVTPRAPEATPFT
jgi:hypothetical protein